MQLRDHPFMTRISGIRAWPPLWVDTRGPSYRNPVGEVGSLKRVEQHAAIANGLFLWIEHEGESYIGMMHFDDLSFCLLIRQALTENIGLTMKEVGDIDLSSLL